MAPPQLSLLGGFTLDIGAGPVELSHSAERVLAFIALQEKPCVRSYVSGTLWPELSDARAGGCLRSALWRLNLIRSKLVEASGQGLRLARDIRLDLHDFVTLASGLLDGSVTLHEIQTRDLRLAGDLLPGWDEDWMIIERERYRQLRLHALEALCAQLTQARSYPRAVEAGLAAVANEPLRESAQRVLIAAHLAEGNRVEAVKQYKVYEDMLVCEMQIRPSEELRHMVDSSLLNH